MVNKSSVSVQFGVIVASWLTLAMTLGTELSAGFKAGLVSVFGHHWIAKAVIISIVFVGISILFSKYDFKNKDVVLWTRMALYSVVISALAILVFYVIEFF